MATNPKRRYIRNQGFQQALDVLDAQLSVNISNKRDAAIRKEDMLTKLFYREVERIDTYKDSLAAAGVSLPKEFQSADFSALIEEASNTNSLTALRDLKKKAQQESAALRELYTGYTKGKGLTSSYIGPASYTEGETKEQSVIFSPAEFETISASLPGYENLDEDAQNAYKQGFLSGNLNQTEALAHLDAQNKYYAGEIDLQNGYFTNATAKNNEFLMGVGNDIERIIESGGIPYSDIQSYYKIPDSLEDLKDLLESLRQGEDFGLSKNSIVGRKIADAISDQGAWSPEEGGFRNQSLVQLAVFSQNVKQDIEELLKKEGTSLLQLNILKRMTPKIYNKKIKELSRKSKTFAALHTVMNDLKKVKLWGNPVIKDAQKGLVLSDKIDGAKYEYALNMSKELASKGLIDDFDIDIVRPETGKSSYKEQDIIEAYESTLIDLDTDYSGETTSYLGLEGISLEKELEESPIDVAAGKLELGEAIIETYDTDVAAYKEAKLEIKQEWVNLLQRSKLANLYKYEIPRLSDISAMKEQLIVSLRIHSNMSTEERNVAEGKIKDFNDFYAKWIEWNRMYSPETKHGRTRDIEELFFEAGFLSEDALPGPRIRSKKE